MRSRHRNGDQGGSLCGSIGLSTPSAQSPKECETDESPKHLCAKRLLLPITSISSLGNSFSPFLWAIMIAAYHMLRRAG